MVTRDNKQPRVTRSPCVFLYMGTKNKSNTVLRRDTTNSKPLLTNKLICSLSPSSLLTLSVSSLPLTFPCVCLTLDMQQSCELCMLQAPTSLSTFTRVGVKHSALKSNSKGVCGWLPLQPHSHHSSGTEYTKRQR